MRQRVVGFWVGSYRHFEWKTANKTTSRRERGPFILFNNPSAVSATLTFLTVAMSSMLELAVAALQSLGAVAFVVAAGWVYALYGYFPLSMQRDLARLVVQLLAPCLLLVSIAHTVSWESFHLWWPIPVLFCALTLASFIFAVVLSFLFRIPRSRSHFIASAAMMSNTNSLPVALMHSLARDPGSRAVLNPKASDADEVARRGIAFVLFFSLFSNILRWTICYQLLAKCPGDEEHAAVQEHEGDAQVTDLIAKQEEVFPGDAVIAEIPDADPQVHATRLRRRSQIFSISADVDSFAATGSAHTASPTERTPLILPNPVPGPQLIDSPTESVPDIPPRSRLRALGTRLYDLMNAPLYAALLALIIGLIPPVKSLFFGPDHGNTGPLEEIVTDPLYSLGEASVPIIILTLGGQLGSMGKVEHVDTAAEGKDVALVILVKMILTPAVGLLMILGMKPFVPLVQDPTFAMAMLLLAACPTALNLMNISQAHRNHETVTARLLFWSYLLSVPILTAWVVADLIILERYWTV
ncbi:uncharacterized protein SPPG_04623 [Spizellomyces punctatus DAOM BR117]|uniref:Auxin efflux carrier n=1 Tax=Spizellomyces punctatus (strain DAOM BR117) TaxID=645134 RepID=A0A0L0HHF1_SPIPD|nr:uncharacterized protein SPPG_04623 [Spizellomyces punctatus DAOM BR117]KND00295.1 hypothetical protein SPPG_04623 [Spizellomyces punctatus DAOM BR117]|eukprot:XP_016608334.1 hypothetical protein SPPG_04623 [Spizellomyces punctatus DAOM BR117]